MKPKLNLIIVLNILIFIVLLGGFLVGGWYNTSYDYMRNITINSTNTIAFTNLSFLINDSGGFSTAALISGNKLQSDCDDLRFIHSSDGAEYACEFENESDITFGCNTDNTLIWCYFNDTVQATNTNSTLYMYYNNSEATDRGVQKIGNSSGKNDTFVLRFKEGNGVNINESSVYLRNGTWIGGASYTKLGKFGWGGNFSVNTSGNYIRFGKIDGHLNLDGNFTIESWVKRDCENNSFTTLLSISTNLDGVTGSIFRKLNLDINKTCGITFNYWTGEGGTSCVSDRNITSNSWQHIAAIYNSTHIGIYINGTLDKICAEKNPLVSLPQGNLSIGYFDIDSPSPFNGSLDNIIISNINKSHEYINRSYEMNLSYLGVEIQYNQAPSIKNISITPNRTIERPYTNSSLTCTTQVYDSDVANTLKVNISWYNGSVYYNSSTFTTTLSVNGYANISLTLGMSSISTYPQGKNDIWNCSANVSDGIEDGAMMSNTTVIFNTAPEIRNITIRTKSGLDKTNIYTNTSVNFSFMAQDVDNDALKINFTWYNNSAGSVYYNSSFISATNGTLYSYFLNITSLLSLETPQAKDETWNLSINASDGTNSSSLNSTTFTTLNTKPNVINFTLFPTTAYKNSTLNITYIIRDIDLDNLLVNITWYNGSDYKNSSQFINRVNGTSYSTYLNYSITPQHKGETWNVSINASDGDVSGDLNSTSKIISNSNPSPVIFFELINNSNISKSLPTFNWTWNDLDNDTLSNILEIDNNYDFSSVVLNKSYITQNYTLALGEELLDGVYYARVRSNDSDSSYSLYSDYINFTVDTVSPHYNLTSPVNGTADLTSAGTSTYTIRLNYSVSDENEISIKTCWWHVNYSQGLLTGTNVNNQTINDCANASVVVTSSEATTFYEVRLYMNDSTGNYNTSGAITVNVKQDVGGGGGGGGGGGSGGGYCGDDLCSIGENYSNCAEDCPYFKITANISWTVEEFYGGSKIDAFMDKNTKRTFKLIFKNNGTQDINFALSCGDSEGDLGICKNILISKRNFILKSLAKEQEIFITVDLKNTTYARGDADFFNIIISDGSPDLFNFKFKITITRQAAFTSLQGFMQKLMGGFYVSLGDIKENGRGFFIPNYLIFLVLFVFLYSLFYFIILKIPLKWVFSLLIALPVSLMVILLI